MTHECLPGLGDNDVPDAIKLFYNLTNYNYS